MAILVTGGAGYIGSVMVESLLGRDEPVVVLDNLSRGHRAAVDRGVPFYRGCIGDRALVKRICEEHQVEACIHFAALAYVSESVSEPKRYFENNVERAIALLDALLSVGVRQFVFSSTCATYGEPVRVPMDETHPQQPTNPYGWSKLILEKALAAYDQAYGMKYVALRYFNAAGATRARGEVHDPETHLIPNILGAALGRLPYVSVYGSDYPTPDGTAIRDYIHVADLASAHVQALEHLRGGGNSECINLGSEHGFSIREVIEMAKEVTRKAIDIKLEPRRAGDPSRLVADAAKAKQVLGWKPQFSGLHTILESAWQWHQAHPNGYQEK